MQEEDPSFWNVKGKEALISALNMKPNMHRANNLILFLGDGKFCITVFILYGDILYIVFNFSTKLSEYIPNIVKILFALLFYY